MPISAARLAANRANAQHSTGPKTEAGKVQVSRNHFVHGLSGTRFILTPWEDTAAYEQLVVELHAEHRPRTPTEKILVNRLAEHHWLRGRALVLQELCFDPETLRCLAPAELALYLRYQTTHERAFARCLAELQKLKKIRPETEVGFEPQTRLESEPKTTIASPSRSQIQSNFCPELKTQYENPVPSPTSALKPALVSPDF